MLSYRGHTLRLTWDAPVENLLLDFVMGSLVDQPIRRYDELFLPGELADALRKTNVVGADGVPRPLVKREPRPLGREAARAADRSRRGAGSDGWLPPASASALRWRRSARVATRYCALLASGSACSSAIVGGVFGFFGTFFLAAWAFTDHEVGYRNENVLLAPPWTLALVVVGVALARESKWAPRPAALIVSAAAASTIFALLVKALTWSSQHNARFLALALPIWIGAAAGVVLYRRAPRRAA